MVLKSQGTGMHSPLYISDSSLAFSIKAASFLAVMYTLTPLAKKPAAIISPIPLEPPVTIATLPDTLKSSAIFIPILAKLNKYLCSLEIIMNSIAFALKYRHGINYKSHAAAYRNYNSCLGSK